jgi:U5 small nuclear ribonucleoprotein component
MTQNFCHATVGTGKKVTNYYRNSFDDNEIPKRLSKCDAKEVLCINIVKLIYNEHSGNFYSFGRIISGTVKRGDSVRVMGEGYTLEEEEDVIVKQISGLWIMQGRYKIEVDMMTAGNWVMIEGIDQSITKTATVVDLNFKGMDIFRPLEFHSEAVIKIACEPLNPSELPKMLEGLRKISKSYPLARTKVEESGEHIIFGSGELYMDSVLSDLRTEFAQVEIKVSEPFVSFSETVADTSSVKCLAETPNKKNQMAMISEPLDKGLAEYIDAGMLDLLPNLLVN